MSFVEALNNFRKSARPKTFLEPLNNRQSSAFPLSFRPSSRAEIELKNLSIDVYTNKHLFLNGSPTLKSGRSKRFDELILPKLKADSKKNLLLSTRSARRNSTHREITQNFIVKPSRTELQIKIPVFRDDETVFSYQRHNDPPPSPSDDEIDRFVTRLHDRDRSNSSSTDSSDRDGFIPFRLPALQRIQTKNSASNARSTLSNYLQKYY